MANWAFFLIRPPLRIIETSLTKSAQPFVVIGRPPFRPGPAAGNLREPYVPILLHGNSRTYRILVNTVDLVLVCSVDYAFDMRMKIMIPVKLRRGRQIAD